MTSVPRPTAWQPAAVLAIRAETPRVKTIRFAVDHWPGHLPGQHLDVRLTAEDGYRAERSYSLASPPEVAGLEITVDRLDDGEVSPFLTDRLSVGDHLDVRGPIGGHFVWSASAGTKPLLLFAGGSGIVPLMCMLRHRRLAGSAVPVVLSYSVRTRGDVIYHDELRALAAADSRITLRIRLTRERPAGRPGESGRLDLAAVRELVQMAGTDAPVFVCGGDAFVEAVAALLVQAGQAPEAIRTERFGPVSA